MEKSLANVKTMAELDTWRTAHVEYDDKGRPFIPSRFSVLKRIVGETQATIILNNLAIDQCCKDVS